MFYGSFGEAFKVTAIVRARNTRAWKTLDLRKRSSRQPGASLKRSSTVFPRPVFAITVFITSYTRIRRNSRGRVLQRRRVVDVVIKSSVRCTLTTRAPPLSVCRSIVRKHAWKNFASVRYFTFLLNIVRLPSVVEENFRRRSRFSVLHMKIIFCIFEY